MYNTKLPINGSFENVMKHLKFYLILLLIELCSCEHKSLKHKPDPYAVKLNDSAMTLFRFMNTDSSKKAISFLDRATSIDSNYYLAYWNKLVIQMQSQNYDRAITTLNDLMRPKPNAADFYVLDGIIHERIGDTVISTKYFKSALAIYNHILDTMSAKNRDFDLLYMDRAFALIMSGEQIKGNQHL